MLYHFSTLLYRHNKLLYCIALLLYRLDKLLYCIALLLYRHNKLLHCIALLLYRLNKLLYCIALLVYRHSKLLHCIALLLYCFNKRHRKIYQFQVGFQFPNTFYFSPATLYMLYEKFEIMRNVMPFHSIFFAVILSASSSAQAQSKPDHCFGKLWHHSL